MLECFPMDGSGHLYCRYACRWGFVHCMIVAMASFVCYLEQLQVALMFALLFLDLWLLGRANFSLFVCVCVCVNNNNSGGL